MARSGPKKEEEDEEDKELVVGVPGRREIEDVAPEEEETLEEPPVAEPAPLGLVGLAVAALVLMSADFGITEGNPGLMLPWTLMLGATAQLIAGIMDFKRKNIFGATVFTTFSLLWYGLSLDWIITLWGGIEGIDPEHLIFAFLGYLVFSLYITVAATATNKVIFTIMVFIDLALLALISHFYLDFATEIIGVTLLGVSVFSFYGSAGVLLNQMAGRTVLPLGGPILELGK